VKQTPLLVCPTLLPSVEQLAIPEFWAAFWSLFFAADFSADTSSVFVFISYVQSQTVTILPLAPILYLSLIFLSCRPAA
jgi:hypothetical protein